MSYDLEKLKNEVIDLEILFLKLKKEWEKLSDYEDLYRVYPLLTTTAALSRKIIGWGIKNVPNVEVVTETLDDNLDTSIYYYYDEKKFFNGEKKVISLKEVCNYFLHQSEYSYMDDRKKDGVMRKENQIYIALKTDKLCRSCAFANNGFFEKDKENYKRTTGFIVYSDCTCTKYINLKSYIKALKDLLSKIC